MVKNIIEEIIERMDENIKIAKEGGVYCPEEEKKFIADKINVYLDSCKVKAINNDITEKYNGKEKIRK